MNTKLSKLVDNACLWWKKLNFIFFMSLFSGIAEHKAPQAPSSQISFLIMQFSTQPWTPMSKQLMKKRPLLIPTPNDQSQAVFSLYLSWHSVLPLGKSFRVWCPFLWPISRKRMMVQNQFSQIFIFLNLWKRYTHVLLKQVETLFIWCIWNLAGWQ